MIALLAGCVAVRPDVEPGAGAEATTVDLPSIVGQSWQLQEIQMANGDTMMPEGEAEYTLLLNKDGNVTGQADCNTINATYTLDGSQISFGHIASTRALCPPGSLFDAYVLALDTASDYTLTNDTLELTFGADDTEGGTLIFRADETTVEPAGEAEATILDDLLGTWQWQAFEDSASGAESGDITVDDPALYVLNLLDDGTAQITADCNVAQMEYSVDGNSLTFLPGPMTLAACGPDSRASEFVMRLGEVASFVRVNEQLVLNLQADAGNLIFAPAAAESAMSTEELDKAVGIYKGIFPAASSPGIDSTLYLSTDNTARLVSDYLNDEAPIVEVGSWQGEGNEGTVTFTGQEEREYDTPQTATFELDGNALTFVYNSSMGSGTSEQHYLRFDALATGEQDVPYDAASDILSTGETDDLTDIYKGFAPAASCCGLDLTLMLSPDGSATLKSDYLNAEEPIVESGTWTAADGTLEVALDDADSPWTYEVSENPLMLISNEISIFGEEPLRLYSLPSIALSMNSGTE